MKVLTNGQAKTH